MQHVHLAKTRQLFRERKTAYRRTRLVGSQTVVRDHQKRSIRHCFALIIAVAPVGCDSILDPRQAQQGFQPTTVLGDCPLEKKTPKGLDMTVALWY